MVEPADILELEEVVFTFEPDLSRRRPRRDEEPIVG